MDHLPTTLIELAGLATFLGYNLWSNRRTHKTVGGAAKDVDDIKKQVTNGGTNLAETVGDVKRGLGEMNRMLGIVTENQRTIHDEHLGALNRNVAVLNEGMQEVRKGLVALEERFDERERRHGDNHERGTRP